MLFIGSGVFALLLLALFLAGPRRRVDTRLARVELPADLPRYLAEREARFPALVPGTEARIRWNEPERREPTPLSIVYFHGFSATRQETAPLVETLARELGANSFELRLTGHGLGGAALGDARAEDWLGDGAEALAIGRRLGERVVVISVSTGGTLATWLLANGHDTDVACLVQLSPNFGVRSAVGPLLGGPWGRQVARVLLGAERSWEPINDAHAAYWTTRYPSRVLVEAQALVELADGADLSHLTAPLLMIYSPEDAVLRTERMIERFEAAASRPKERVAFLDDEDPKHHVLAGDALSPGSTEAIAERILRFVRPLGRP